CHSSCKASRSRSTQLSSDVFSEDVGVVEAMQKGRHSAGFAGGAFSPVMDGPTHAFHKWLARQYKNN
ncbi:MAG: SRPBCC family protein, partial [Litorivicinus sp.]